jgi:hypothetical protein
MRSRAATEDFDERRRQRPFDEVAARMAAETIAAQQAELRRLEGVVAERTRGLEAAATMLDTLEAKLATLIVAAGAALDYISENIDADLRDDRFRGNRESDLANELSEAIRKAKGERP